MAGLDGKKVAFLVANEGVEQVELEAPWEALREAGAETELIAPDSGEVQAFEHLDKGERFPVDRTVSEADPDRRTLTSWPSLKTDVRNAGGDWVDEEVHVDGGLVTSRKPDDLEAFCAKAIEEIGEGVHERQREATVAS